MRTLVSRTDLRTALDRLWLEITERAARSRDMDGVLPAFAGVYDSLDASERLIADDLIVEWVMSDDPGRRYVGLGLVARFGIRNAVPSLTELLNRLDEAEDPSAPYDAAKINRILQQFDAAQLGGPEVTGRV